MTVIQSQQLFAIIPACGLSRRMGRPKLLLEINGQSVIRRLLDALNQTGIRNRLVVVRESDNDLRREVESVGGTVVRPAHDPPDMRSSVQVGLDAIRERYAPSDFDGWLLVPGDHPVLSAAVITQLIDEWSRSAADVLIPTFRGKRGHPTIFRWRTAADVPGIPENRGLNQLVQQFKATCHETSVDDSAVVTDLDTPADYDRLCRQFA